MSPISTVLTMVCEYLNTQSGLYVHKLLHKLRNQSVSTFPGTPTTIPKLLQRLHPFPQLP